MRQTVALARNMSISQELLAAPEQERGEFQRPDEAPNPVASLAPANQGDKRTNSNGKA